MEQNQRFAILTFPQFFDGNTLGLNIVFLPRNQNPLVSAIDGEPPSPGAAALRRRETVLRRADRERALRPARGNAGACPTAAGDGAADSGPAAVRSARQPILDHQPGCAEHECEPRRRWVRPSRPRWRNRSRNTCRTAIGISSTSSPPRTPNAVTDDSYHCAVRGAAPKPGFVPSPDKISWGQVFASAIRQPQLATALGMIYQTQITIGATDFAKGGWLYVDLADDSDYKAQQAIDATFVKRYAARIPVLEIGKPRSVFGAIQFPVVTVAPKGDYDELFIEAADYDDGFAKIVHAFQPVSNSLLLEQSDGFHPTRDVGIRLGWDDEQILIWYIRQLAEDPLVGAGKRIDAPIGAFGYKVDVREDKQPPVPWESLNQVDSKAALSVVNPVTNEVVTLGNVVGKELLYQVYPAQLDGDLDKCYWLPMYFAAWAGKSMVLPDEDASAIYQHGDAKARPEINVSGPPQNQLNKVYEASGLTTRLRYGKSYQFRIRLGDMSGGGPELGRTPQDETQIADDVLPLQALRRTRYRTHRRPAEQHRRDPLRRQQAHAEAAAPRLSLGRVHRQVRRYRPDRLAAGGLQRRVGQAAFRTAGVSASPTRMWTAWRSRSSFRP